MRYVSTRATDHTTRAFSDILLEGLARSGVLITAHSLDRIACRVVGALHPLCPCGAVRGYGPIPRHRDGPGRCRGAHVGGRREPNQGMSRPWGTPAVLGYPVSSETCQMPPVGFFLGISPVTRDTSSARSCASYFSWSPVA